jgi:hypothetical protein
MKLFRDQPKKRILTLTVTVFVGIAAISWVVLDRYLTGQHPVQADKSAKLNSICRISSKEVVSERLNIPAPDLVEEIRAFAYAFPPPGFTSVRCEITNRSKPHSSLLTLHMAGQSWEADSPGYPFGDFIRAIDTAPDRVRLPTEPGTGIRDGAAKGHGAYYIKECTGIEWTIIQINSTKSSASVSANDWLAILEDAKTNLEKLNPCAKRPPPTDK